MVKVHQQMYTTDIHLTPGHFIATNDLAHNPWGAPYMVFGIESYTPLMSVKLEKGTLRISRKSNLSVADTQLLNRYIDTLKEDQLQEGTEYFLNTLGRVFSASQGNAVLRSDALLDAVGLTSLELANHTRTNSLDMFMLCLVSQAIAAPQSEGTATWERKKFGVVTGTRTGYTNQACLPGAVARLLPPDGKRIMREIPVAKRKNHSLMEATMYLATMTGTLGLGQLLLEHGMNVADLRRLADLCSD